MFTLLHKYLLLHQVACLSSDLPGQGPVPTHSLKMAGATGTLAEAPLAGAASRKLNMRQWRSA